jgi:hypothetical protein
MTTHDGFNSMIGEARIETRDRDRPNKDLRISDQEAAAWAALLVGVMPTPELRQWGGASPVPQTKSLLTAEERLTSATPAEASIAEGVGSQCADTPSVNATHEQRLILNVDSETLGRVQLIVDREAGGVRLLVGSDPAANARLSQGKHGLGEALASAGVRVHSLRFVTQSEVGTVLAQDRLSKRARSGPSSQSNADEDIPSPSKSKKKRNLKLVG